MLKNSKMLKNLNLLKNRVLLLLLLLSTAFTYAQVGIGTETPQAKLHVQGSFQVDEELKVNGSETNEGNSGNPGDVLTSNGEGKSPVWKKPTSIPNGGIGDLVVYGMAKVDLGDIWHLLWSHHEKFNVIYSKGITCRKVNTGPGTDIITCTFDTPVPDDKYMIIATSNFIAGNISAATVTPIFKSKSRSSFTLGFAENIELHGETQVEFMVVGVK